MNEKIKINLAQFRSHGAKVFSGRPRGNQVREELQLDNLDKNGSVSFEVIVPEDIYSINTSFFLGLFGQSVRAAKNKDNFLEKFIFIFPNNEIKEDILYGIERALKEETRLTSSI